MIRRPSRYKELAVCPSRFLPPKGFFAITLFGRIFIRRSHFEQWEASKDTPTGRIILHHEWIHLRQAVSTHNSWLCFYLRYLYYYLKNRPLIHGTQFAYHANPFEMEAYTHETDLQYAHEKTYGTDEWRLFAEMTLVQRREYLRKNHIL